MAAEICVSSVNRAATQQAAELPPQFAATSPAGSTGLLGWIAATARAVGGACLHLLKSPAGGALILTSVCLALAYKQKKARSSTPPTPPPRQPFARSMSLAMLQGGDKAMQRFKLIHHASPAELSTAVEDMRRELQQPRLDFVKLYANVGIVELSGKEKEAIELLEGALKKAKELQQTCEHTHEVHELELLLVEMYIYKGDYGKALSFPCLKREDVSSADARAPLYRAVIYILMNDEDGRAKESYEKWKEVWSLFHGNEFYQESSSMSLQVANFDEFTEMVKRLKLEIQQAHSAKPTAEGQDRSKQVAEEKKREDKTTTPSSSEEKKNPSKK
ncbi:uncharacterized protein LOC141836112 [Curcuma longa]|uniref:uncharacterized protein LOC141836112 n=1 Tax=Curcuma longa TaxID=136217 RepID=UPI003D9F3EBD